VEHPTTVPMPGWMKSQFSAVACGRSICLGSALVIWMTCENHMVKDIFRSKFCQSGFPLQSRSKNDQWSSEGEIDPIFEKLQVILQVFLIQRHPFNFQCFFGLLYPRSLHCHPKRKVAFQPAFSVGYVRLQECKWWSFIRMCVGTTETMCFFIIHCGFLVYVLRVLRHMFLTFISEVYMMVTRS